MPRKFVAVEKPVKNETLGDGFNWLMYESKKR